MGDGSLTRLFHLASSSASSIPFPSPLPRLFSLFPCLSPFTGPFSIFPCPSFFPCLFSSLPSNTLTYIFSSLDLTQVSAQCSPDESVTWRSGATRCDAINLMNYAHNSRPQPTSVHLYTPVYICLLRVNVLSMFALADGRSGTFFN